MFSIIQVKTTADDGEFEFNLYGYNTGGSNPLVIYSLNKKLSDTIPSAITPRENDNIKKNVISKQDL